MIRRIIIGILISIVFLYLAIRGIQWSEFTAVLKRTRFEYLLLACLLNIFGHYARAYRWKFMLGPVKNMPTSSLFSATSIGYMANNLLPARLGEVVRAYVIARKEAISKAASFATIVYERVVDVFVLLALLWLTLFRIPGPAWLKQGGLVLLILNMLMLIVLIVMNRGKRRIDGSLAARTTTESRIAARVLRVLRSFLSGLDIVSTRRGHLPIAAISIVVWFAAAFRVYCCFEALDMTVPLMASVTLLVFVSVAAMIPSAPAYLGTTQYACVLGLAIYGVGKSEALAYSVVFHFTQVVPVTVGGLFFLWREQLGLTEISRTSETIRHEA